MRKREKERRKGEEGREGVRKGMRKREKGNGKQDEWGRISQWAVFKIPA